MAEGWVQEDNEALVMQMLDEFIAEHAATIDTDRIYIQGLSMGGYGTWKIILDHPEIFAAAMPMCGGVDDSYYANNNEAFQKIKIWQSGPSTMRMTALFRWKIPAKWWRL